MNSTNFQRVNDHTYRFTTVREDDFRQEIFINVHGQKTHEAYRTSKAISNYLIQNKHQLSNKSEVFFQINNKIFKYRIINSSRHERLARYLANFFKFFRNPSKIEIDISQDSTLNPLKLPTSVIKLPSSDIETMSIPSTSVPTSHSSLAAFSDGYTKLAAEAFQKYEQEFAPHDYILSKSDHSKYRIVQTDENIELIHESEYSHEEEGLTLHNYRDYLFKEYGKKKIEYIAHLYRIDLYSKGPLTPEIIYRMNIGVGNLEKQDVELVVSKLDEMISLLQKNKKFDLDWLDRFTTHELRGIKRLCAADQDLAAQNLELWLGSFYKLSPVEKLKTAISILSFQPAERVLQYTGRDIVYPIKGCYILGDNAFYKPWVDQQELLQTFDNIKSSFSNRSDDKIWDNYYEVLSHVICKKHLARQHPDEGFRVGAIIPAPPSKSKDPRWYVVSTCISNGKGIHGYTLEPLDHTDSSLPVIKLFRSTSSKPYAIDGRSTVKNDFNPINSPGYEGSELIRKYQDDYFKQRTIPLWVAYNIQAARALKSSSGNSKVVVKGSIYKAIETYKSDQELSYKSIELDAIVRKHDSDLLQLANNLLQDSIFNFFKVFRIIRIVYRYKRTKVSQQTQKDDSRFLLSLLVGDNAKLYGLKQSLKSKAYEDAEKSLEETRCHKKIHQLLELFLNEKYEEIINELNRLAQKRGELPQQKTRQSIIFAGHSLGGACAQKFLVDYTAKAGRIPLEGMEFGVRSFDSPGINREDNKLFKQFGNHHNLFHNLGINFSIVHRFEAGDFISQTGGEHLGAAANETERHLLQSWTQFQTTVSEGLKTSAVKEIRDFYTAHATQFENGKRNPSFIINSAKNMLNSKTLDEQTKQKVAKLVKDRLGDYERTWIDPQVLWSFDNQDKHNWKDIQNTWREPGLFSTTIEKLRSFIGVVIRIILVGNSLNQPVEEQEDVGHGDWWKYRDARGVFAVDLSKGVSSK